MINYQFIAKSCAFYESLGYLRVEAPWWTSKEINYLTKPDELSNVPDFYLPVNNKVLVASAEQAFLALAEKNLLTPGRIYGVTPCFRNEPETHLNKQYFIKTELMETGEILDSKLSLMVGEAFSLFSELVPDKNKLAVVSTEEGYDIEYGGVEIGSYGSRSCAFLDWIYGTGLAEPRLSVAIREGKS